MVNDEECLRRLTRLLQFKKLWSARLWYRKFEVYTTWQYVSVSIIVLSSSLVFLSRCWHRLVVTYILVFWSGHIKLLVWVKQCERVFAIRMSYISLCGRWSTCPKLCATTYMFLRVQSVLRGYVVVYIKGVGYKQYLNSACAWLVTV